MKEGTSGVEAIRHGTKDSAQDTGFFGPVGVSAETAGKTAADPQATAHGEADL